MRVSLSLRTRLIAGIALVAVILALAGWAIVATTRSHLVGQVDGHLSDAADPDRDGRLGDHIHDDRGESPSRSRGGGSHDHEPTPREEPGRLSNMFEGAVRRDHGLEVVYESNFPEQAWSPPDLDWNTAVNSGSEPFSVSGVDDDVRYRVLAVRLDDTVFVRALPLVDVEETVDRLILYVTLGAVAVFVVLAAVAWWVIRLGIQPIKAMTQAATQIAEGDLSVRVPESGAVGTEAGALSRGLNTMLSRIKEAVDAQAQSEQQLRRFVADASHELRTPVTTIRGYAELYRHGGLSDQAALDDAMRRTEQEAQRLDRLVEDMLTLTKYDQQRPMDHREINLATLVADTGADARVTAPDHDIIVTTATELTVVGDEDRLRQLLANVVGNASVHTPPGTAITIDARRADDDVVVEIGDDGPGIEPEHLDRVTERFYRADPSRSREQGSFGLGLAIADAVAQAHGGFLRVTSEPGRGTTVTITLPTHAAQASTPEGEPDKEEP
ncbi:sensor histidine kinase [Candidatus Poriferisocius sp.]|uniref:sensor histidine kinase n=1 Tax=Candidatus Poriferisocius sp. TaxID=3101276 RepID=UPI003B596511